MVNAGLMKKVVDKQRLRTIKTVLPLSMPRILQTFFLYLLSYNL
jgi:hypothetical protein